GGSDAHHQHGQEHPESDRGGETNAECDRKGQIEAAHVGKRNHAGYDRVPVQPCRAGSRTAAMLALVREVSPQLAQCELTHLERNAIDAQRAMRQHRDYTQTLLALGCSLEWLPPLPQHPDSVFVEDTAVVVAEIAVVTRPGAASRRGETATVGEALEQHTRVSAIADPGCLDGGDVLHIDRTLHVGASGRT